MEQPANAGARIAGRDSRGSDKHSRPAAGANHLSQALKQTLWRRPAFLLVGLAVVAFRDLALLRRYGFPLGVDGYYYLLQVDELQTKGHLYFHSATPFVVYFLAGVGYLTGNSIFGIKLGAVVLHALLCAGIFALLASTIRSGWIAISGGALPAVSGLHFYMLSEFIANLMAIMLLVWCAFCVIQLIQTRRIAWAAYAVVLLVGAAFSHRSALVIVLAVVIFAGLLYWLFAQDSLRGYRPYAALLFVSIVWLSPAILAMQSFARLPKWLTDEVLTVPKLPFDQYALGDEILLLIASLLVLFLLLAFRRRLPRGAGAYFFGSVALWSLVVTMNPFLNPVPGWLSLAGRLRGLAYIQVAILVPALLWWVIKLRRELAPYAVAVTIPFVLLSALSPRPRGMQPDYLSARQQLLTNLPRVRPQLGPNPIVIAAHGDEFLVTSVLGVPSQHTRPANTNHQDVFWLLRNMNNEDLTVLVLDVKPDSQSMSTVLIEDTELQAQLREMPDAERRRLFSINPHLATAYYSGDFKSTTVNPIH